MECETKEVNASLISEHILNIFQSFLCEISIKNTLPQTVRNIEHLLERIDATSKFLAEVSFMYYKELNLTPDDFYYQLFIERVNFANIGKVSPDKKNLYLRHLVFHLLKPLVFKDEVCDHPDNQEYAQNCEKCCTIKMFVEKFTSKEEFNSQFIAAAEKFNYNYDRFNKDIGQIANSLSITQSSFCGSLGSHFLNFRKNNFNGK